MAFSRHSIHFLISPNEADSNIDYDISLVVLSNGMLIFAYRYDCDMPFAWWIKYYR